MRTHFSNNHRLLLQTAIALLLATALQAGETAAPTPEPLPDGYSADFTKGSWIVGWESAQIFGMNNRNDYHLAPQYLNIEWHGHGVVDLGSWRMSSPTILTIGVVPVVHGPESLWFGGALGGGFMFWKAGSRWAAFIRGSGGIGTIDSTDALDAQGQDFTFTAIAGAGALYRASDTFTVSLGVYFQHISNGNLSEPERPNVGLDSVGLGVGIRCRF